jgi:hypothetical protein
VIQQLIDQLLAWASQRLGDDIVGAKKEYFARTGGDPHEDDRSFEARMQGFFNWYLFDRRTEGQAGEQPQTPAQQFLHEKGGQIFGSDKELLVGATQSRLSLYLFQGRRTLLRRVPAGMVRVRDAFTGDDYDVVEKRQMTGLESGDLFEARLIPVGGKYQFSSSFLFHPREVKRTVLKEIKRRRKALQLSDPSGFCWEVSKMALQAERFRNVAIHAIYNFETPFLGHKKPKTGEPGASAAGDTHA